MTELNAVRGAARLSCHAVERTICEIWSDYFGRVISPYDDFFELGGDSLGMIDVVALARERGLPVRSSVALRNPSPARLAESLTIRVPAPADGLAAPLPALYLGDVPALLPWTDAQTGPVPIVPGGAGAPLLVVHSDSHVQAERDAIAAWGSTRPVSGFRLPGNLDILRSGDPVGEIANRFLAALRHEQPTGPYRLAGFGPGAVVAFELAQRVRAGGDEVALLVLGMPPAIDATATVASRDRLLRQRLAALAARFGLGGGASLDEIHARVRAGGWYDDRVRPEDLPLWQRVWVELELAVRAYRFARYDGAATLFHDRAATGGVTERALAEAVRDLEIHRPDHGIESPHAVIRDPRLARFMRRALS
jgi:thioesterase domain-containing protein